MTKKTTKIAIVLLESQVDLLLAERDRNHTGGKKK